MGQQWNEIIQHVIKSNGVYSNVVAKIVVISYQRNQNGPSDVFLFLAGFQLENYITPVDRHIRNELIRLMESFPQYICHLM